MIELPALPMVRSRLRATAVLAVLAAACLNALAQSDTPRWDTFAQAADRPRLSTPQNAALLVFLRALDAPELAQAAADARRRGMVTGFAAQGASMGLALAVAVLLVRPPKQGHGVPATPTT